MLRNFIRIAFRNLLKYKTFSAVNLAGLSVGLACFLLICLWIRDETSYDDFHESGDRIYRVMENQTFTDGAILTQAEAPGLLGETLRNEVPELVYAATMDWWTNTLISYENQSVKEEGRYVGEDFLKMFSFPLIKGDKETALSQPGAIVISERLAQKLFPGAEAMGKTLRLANFSDYVVTGVMADLPSNTVFKFDFLLPYHEFIQRNAWARDWNNNGLHTYVMLREDTDPLSVNRKIKDVVARHGDQDNVELFLQPLGDIYLKTDYKNGVYQGGGRMEYVRLFGIVGLLILLLACINFMNLSTARAAVRAREVGVKKVVGAGRRVLIAQFNAEALIVCILAAVIAVLTVQASLPAFNQFTGKAIRLPFTEPAAWLILGGIVLLTSLLAGVYPAILLSAFRPVSVLKGQFDKTQRGLLLRKTLVVAQFAVAVFMVVSMLVAHRQLNYLQTKNLGYDREQLLFVTMNHEIQDKYASFSAELERLPAVKAVSASHSPLTGFINASDNFSWPGKNPNDNRMIVYENVAPNYLGVIGAELSEGRDFSRQFPSDSANFIINELAAEQMGLKPPLVGQRLKAWGKEGQIVGVVKNFHFSSLKEQLQPLVLMMSSPYVWTAYIRIDGRHTVETLDKIEKVCKKYSPAYPFEYKFADSAYDELYKSEHIVGRIAAWFAILAVFISCLGLFGLATFSAERRVKEIGIRKVLGATAGDVVRLLSRDFLKLVLLGIAIATPVAWWATHRWLSDFPYRIELSWWIFVLAGSLSIAIAFITVSFQSVRAALSNPVKSLRSE